MRPCADPRICGVKNHKPGTVCKAEQARRGGAPKSPAGLTSTPPSASVSIQRDDRPSYAGPAPSEAALEIQENSFQQARWIMEQDPVSQHLDLDDHIPGTSGHLVRAREGFRTKSIIVREGDYVPVDNMPKTNRSIIMPPHKWGNQYNPTNAFRHLEDVEDYLPERIDRSEEQRELRDELVKAYLDKGTPKDVEMKVNGHPVTFTLNGEGAFHSTSDVAHISIERHDGEVMHGWARTSNGSVVGSFLGDADGERYTDKLPGTMIHDPSSPFPSDVPTDYYGERGNRDTFDQEEFRKQSNSGYTLRDYEDTMGEALSVYRQMDANLGYHRAEQRDPSSNRMGMDHLANAMDELARFRIQNDN